MAELIPLAPARGAPARHVIFVHGLSGGPRGTWTSPPPPPPRNRIWPNCLAEDVEGLAVWSVGYDAPVSNERVGDGLGRPREECALCRSRKNSRHRAKFFCASACIVGSALGVNTSSAAPKGCDGLLPDARSL